MSKSSTQGRVLLLVSRSSTSVQWVPSPRHHCLYERLTVPPYLIVTTESCFLGVLQSTPPGSVHSPAQSAANCLSTLFLFICTGPGYPVHSRYFQTRDVVSVTACVLCLPSPESISVHLSHMFLFTLVTNKLICQSGFIIDDTIYINISSH